MKQTMIARVLGATLLSTAFAMSAVAAEKGDTNKSGAYESGDRGVTTPASPGTVPAQRVPKAEAGTSVAPSANQPASVSESAPQKTGKKVEAGKVADDKTMPNPKSAANPNESAPAHKNTGATSTSGGTSTATSDGTSRDAGGGSTAGDRTTPTAKTPTSPNESGPLRDKMK
jgi:hypothetical protein